MLHHEKMNTKKKNIFPSLHHMYKLHAPMHLLYCFQKALFVRVNLLSKRKKYSNLEEESQTFRLVEI